MVVFFNVRRLLLIFIMMLIATVAIAQNTVVKGKISSGDGALSGATVLLGRKAAISKENGEYYFSVQPGIYTITVTYAGFKKMMDTVNVVGDSTNSFDFMLQPLGPLENVIIVGSRFQKQRSNLSTPVPVDLLQLSKLPERQVEMTKMITNYIPSFNAAPHGFMSGKHMVPASLRGLGPDQTLVLLNGRRQHMMAAPWTGGVTGLGTVGTDLNAIPSDAVEKVEVLRDGAAAQYGSDAIAGVIHLRMKESTGVTSVRLNTGQYYKGDGESFSLGINHGLKFLKKGFLNLTGQFRFSNYTRRNEAYDSLVYYAFFKNITDSQKDSIWLLDNKKIAERGFNRLNHRPVGDNRIVNTALAMNGGYPVNQTVSLYWTGIFNYRFVKDISSNLYRYPKDSAMSGNLKIYPDGFLPYVESKLPDMTVIGGVKGATKNGWQWDAGSIFGRSSVELDVTNSINASQYFLGDVAPTRFYTGKQAFSQITNNVSFSRELSKKSPEIKSINLAAGAEWRIERYRIEEGEEASWKNYSVSSRRAGGSQGVAGFQPENVIDTIRHVLATFAEMELRKNRKLVVNVAGRFEHYTDYGSNLAGKIAFGYKLLKKFSWRGSVSNGFRAPALQQRYYSLVTTASRNSITLVRNGTFPNESGIAKAFGISKLQPEKSINASTGFTSSICKNLSFTIDAYWIQIEDRIIYGGAMNADSFPEVRHILDSFNFKDVQTVRFFSNAINTHTLGLDLVFNGRWFFGKTLLQTSLAVNINKSELYGSTQYAKNLPDNEKFRSILVNREEKCRVEEAYPKDKIILNIDYKFGRWSIHPAFTRYGKVTQRVNNPVLFPDQTFSPKIVTSLNLKFDMTAWLSVTVGGENIFNTYPDRLKNYANTASGLLPYSFNFAPFGVNGGYYFVVMNFNL